MVVGNIQTHEHRKDSGVAWLGEIPGHWQIKPGLVALSENKRDNKGMKETQVLSLSYGNIIVKPEEKLTGLVPESFETYQVVEPGDIIIRGTDLQNDQTSLRTGLAKDRGIITSAYIGLRVKNGFNPSFVHYYLHALDTCKILYKFGSGLRQNLGFEDFKRLPIVEVPTDEQDAIVRFLDQKSAKIDAAIALEERQIALLKERKQIVIQNAVTKGLNPNAPMKNSGVDWIGEIPAHWDVRRNAAIFTESKRSGNASLPVLSVSIHSGVSDRELSDDENIRSAIKIEDRTAYKEVRPGFVTYNMMRAWQGGIGAVRTLGMVSPAYVVLEPKIALNSDYFEYLYRTPAFIWQMDCNSKGITDFRKRLYWEEFKTLVTLLPPAQEQAAISTVIAEKSAVIDGGIALKRKQIAALKEYKATLINSAVTGKIKVA